MGKIEIWERDGKIQSFILTTIVSLKEDDNLALEWRGAFIKFSYRNPDLLKNFGKLSVHYIFL